MKHHQDPVGDSDGSLLSHLLQRRGGSAAAKSDGAFTHDPLTQNARIAARGCSKPRLGGLRQQGLFGGAACAFILACACPSFADPYVPQNRAQILERLRSTVGDFNARELRGFRTRLSSDPENLELAEQYARRCIGRSRSEADPRYLGRAQAALAPWWNLRSPPAQALVLRATIRQSQHDFTSALADLELALSKDPRNAQAWLTRATILTVTGDYAAARKACLPLAQLAPGLVALTAAAEVACLNGQAERGRAILRDLLANAPSGGSGEKVWALTLFGEASARCGHDAEAETAFRKGLELDPHDAYLLAACADLLLDQGRAREVVELLKDETRPDSLLLRLAIAESRILPRPADFATHLASLRSRFEEGHLRGDFVHQREEAIFALHLLKSPGAGVHMAQDNWRVQREPADARILLECALAARDRLAAQPVLEFLRTTRLEDIRLHALASQFEHSIGQ